MRLTTRLGAAAVLVLAGCGDAPPTAAPDATDSPGPTASASVALPDPGRPYDAEDLLDAMRDSRRPGGVPAELQDPRIAAELAARLWTFDGEPWDAIAAGGACDASGCSLELSGGTDATDGEDVWRFSIDTSSGAVEVVDADLHAVPDDTAAALDRWVRALDAGGPLDGLRATAVRWLPPPAQDRFRLAYRSGDEEGACSVDVELDAATGRIIESSSTGC